jgi:hypothetical protein
LTTPSGPGAFSQRTDKQPIQELPNAQYGENKDYQDIQSGAPMAADAGTIAGAFNSQFGNPAQNVVGLGEATQQPNTPVTDGAASGPGAGPEALNIQPSQDDKRLNSYLVALEFMANMPGSSDSARNLVRQMKSQL